MSKVIRPFTYESDEDLTLDDLEEFCRNARRAGGSGPDVLRARTTWYGGVRRLRLRLKIGHNRDAAYQRDHTGGAANRRDHAL